MRFTKKQLEKELNETGAPPDELKSNGGRMPDHLKYGTWLRRVDPIAFEVEYHEKYNLS